MPRMILRICPPETASEAGRGDLCYTHPMLNRDLLRSPDGDV